MAASTKYEYVKDIMSQKKVYVVTQESSVKDALILMRDNRVHRLPVLSDDSGSKLVGIITDRDIRLAASSPFLAKTEEEVINSLNNMTVKQIMHSGVVTIEQDSPIVEAAKLLRVSDIGGLPVLDKTEQLVGVISRSDILDHYIRTVEPLAANIDTSSYVS